MCQRVMDGIYTIWCWTAPVLQTLMTWYEESLEHYLYCQTAEFVNILSLSIFTEPDFYIGIKLAQIEGKKMQF